MSTSTILATTLPDDDAWADAVRSAAAFIAGFRSPDTRKGYRRDLRCWLEFCAAHDLHPYVGVRRTHVEVYLRQLEQQVPVLANSTSVSLFQCTALVEAAIHPGGSPRLFRSTSWRVVGAENGERRDLSSDRLAVHVGFH